LDEKIGFILFRSLMKNIKYGKKMRHFSTTLY